ncbi:acetyl/propionyl/methylcrotonyl-CoA carboxylase subunit alpha [Oceanicella actignis]|uniref:acetyl/propionyl/methylcrotonyl-CoA carboxylase subunit alpha n=1 Tax=Oceanicella actignis TaxID=1189325 RepID=UPI0011E64338|nr:biotin carboxylase N-terminal domain-containing protein [Oceanicella actignis]TYO84861.1 3-methylcrotonyl-CoA carboxylase alpha subunit [Oceanicella actignis]
MFRKILIANRGEIAVRIARTARRMGVKTVAVHSDVDANAPHVAACDEAALIGPAPAAESYLRGDRIIAAALAAGAEAIHPGYGFLSENPDFVEAVEAAGLTFIGPPAAAIRAMGLKDAAKAAMEKAGVPVVPGYHGAEQDPAFLKARADEIGYPVLIKARAGGGGKGMRKVDRPEDFLPALEAAQGEGRASFGDGACLIEKWIVAPRHVEIQVFGDSHGGAVHLFERDCSLQRRHQKVIEEAPAPGMTEEMRRAMGDAAVRAARAIGYAGAGTVEFIVDASEGLRPDRFYFMEMNTRLQVEHPVTEAVAGLDLVEWQLRVAAGEPLPLRQEDLRIDGWAFEARLYAEDPARGFMPATGRLRRLRLPEDRARIDAGVREGDEIPPHYDPMIAKVIVHGRDREEARLRLIDALEAAEIAGSTTNLAFLARLAADPDFAAGRVDTGLIDRKLAQLSAPPELRPETPALAAIAALGLHEAAPAPAFDDRSGWRLWDAETREVALIGPDGAARAVRLQAQGPGRFAAEGREIALSRHDGRLRASVDGGPARPVTLMRWSDAQGVVAAVIDGPATTQWRLPDPLESADDAAAGGDAAAAPMPGLVKAVFVAPGDAVKSGDALIVMEAMKMEHRLTAPRDGVVASVACAPGAQVAEGAVLLTLEPEE